MWLIVANEHVSNFVKFAREQMKRSIGLSQKDIESKKAICDLQCSVNSGKFIHNLWNLRKHRVELPAK